MTNPPQPPVLSVFFANLNAADTVAYTRRFVARVKNHPALTGTWSKYSGSPDELLQLCVEVEAADLAAEGHGVNEECKTKTLVLKRKLAYATMHVEMVVESDIATLQPLGLKMRQLPIKKGTTSIFIDTAPHLTVSHGKSTELKGKSTRPKGAAGIHVQITEDPGTEGNWIDVDTFLNLTFKIPGLVPGKTYFLRARGKGRNGETGPWSNIVTIIAL